ncbi:hypothetical protein PoB_004970600 [Plakobranchus ocellatus]|uniref:Uncharacterized protein n=1 Tax=Plakobranchus ocellatus TaxID=259542 RepID=A0AAV4BIJ5_9GAST|nr:hypothetical protein PoB_004970600 [Plakobranchus ocellatus]
MKVIEDAAGEKFQDERQGWEDTMLKHSENGKINVNTLTPPPSPTPGEHQSDDNDDERTKVRFNVEDNYGDDKEENMEGNEHTVNNSTNNASLFKLEGNEEMVLSGFEESNEVSSTCDLHPIFSLTDDNVNKCKDGGNVEGIVSFPQECQKKGQKRRAESGERRRGKRWHEKVTQATKDDVLTWLSRHSSKQIQREWILKSGGLPKSTAQTSQNHLESPHTGSAILEQNLVHDANCDSSNVSQHAEEVTGNPAAPRSTETLHSTEDFTYALDPPKFPRKLSASSYHSWKRRLLSRFSGGQPSKQSVWLNNDVKYSALPQSDIELLNFYPE